MNTSNFLKIKMTAKKPEFKELIGLTERTDNASFIIDFCTLLHPNQAKTAQGSKVNVFTNKGHYIYTLYNTCILKTNVEKGTKTMYKL